MSPMVPQQVLVYDRIAQNRRKTVLLVAVAILSIVPFVAGISYTAADIFAPMPPAYRPEPVEVQADTDTDTDAEAEAEDPGLKERRAMIARFEADRRRRVEERINHVRAVNGALRIRLMSLVALGLTASLGLLFWGLASSPTSNVLAMCGARPASTAEAEAKRLLENLAIGAGLPPPKLYVIDTLEPNAFAAGTDPARSVVVVTQGLISLLDRRELEGVLAHELSHIGNRDTRLNTIVASIALFLRLPYLLRRRTIEARRGQYYHSTLSRKYRRCRLMLSPIYIYIFFIAPLLASIIRSSISRSREFLADADAALLTRYPEGLIRALAKIRGAGSTIAAQNPIVAHLYFADPVAAGTGFGLLSANLLATHPPIDKRITRLMEFHAGVTPATIEAAVRAGQEFTRNHPAVTPLGMPESLAKDELSMLSAGNPMGRVYRIMGAKAPVAIYDRADVKSGVLTRVAPDSLLVVFDDPGKLRQVITPNQTFGYLPLSVKLQRVDLLPEEVYTGKAHMSEPAPVAAAPPVAQPPMPSPAPAPVVAAPPAQAWIPPARQFAPPVAPKTLVFGLTPGQVAIAAAFGTAVFVGFCLVLVKLG